jgi:glycosyltransferase involved in cell wall biosynthesis
MTPKVSICVPNLNTRPFLPERFRTIAEQTLQDWELLVYDSYSTDGAWEYIQERAAVEPRMRAWQGPREGTPGSWSPCVREAKGEYVYIATSDDTMPPECLATLVAALDAHPDCDIAHCRLQPIDEHGRDIPAKRLSWSRRSLFAMSSGDWLDRVHVRRAPFDGLLHLSGGSVYISITQLLIRRSLFDRIGLFESTWGSIGDFNWSMRAGLVANTVHVPGTWGGWRVHASQATAGVRLESEEHAGRIDAMIDDAIARCRAYLAPDVYRRLTSRWLVDAREQRSFRRHVASRRGLSAWRRATFLAEAAWAGSPPARAYLASRLRRRAFPDWVRRRLEETGAGPSLVPDLPQSSNSR